MIILSDCLSEQADEGCLNVANSLIKRIKHRYPDTTIISYGKRVKNAEEHVKLNKFFLNKKLLTFLRKSQQQVLYIPFSSNTSASIIRVFILSLVSEQICVVFSLRHPMNKMCRQLLRASRAKVIALSKESYNFYQSVVGENAIYLKAGVDLKKFYPVSKSRKKELQKKYNVAHEKKVLLHVGHLKKGRNIDKLLLVNSDYHIYLVVSSETEKDFQLWDRLLQRPNTTIIDHYIDRIEELYQMSDVYFFPVQEEENCIDVPLSVLEAAACNIPIVSTKYGELKELKRVSGIEYLDDVNKKSINQALNSVIKLVECNSQLTVDDYDWDKAVDKMVYLMDKNKPKDT